MKYVASLPTMPSYLEQFVRSRSGYCDVEKTTLSLQGFQAAAMMLKRDLVPFADEETARKKWPTAFTGVRVGLPELRLKHARDGMDDCLFVLGPNCASEVVGILTAFFDLSLMQEWTVTLAEYTKLMMVPEKKRFILAFLERYSIEYSERNYCAIEKRLLRIINSVEHKAPITESGTEI